MRICSKCIMDETISDITFDKNGICSYCYIHDELNKAFPQNNSHLKIIEKIKKTGKNKK